jgi:hypothetical protein
MSKLDKLDIIENLLVMLGDSPDAVAERLLAEGCFGNHYCRSCPVSQYLAKHGHAVAVQSFKACYEGPIESPQYMRYGSEIDIDLPTAVTDFLDRYDNLDTVCYEPLETMAAKPYWEDRSCPTH